MELSPSNVEPFGRVTGNIDSAKPEEEHMTRVRSPVCVSPREDAEWRCHAPGSVQPR
jgi:hypothetical protein